MRCTRRTRPPEEPRNARPKSRQPVRPKSAAALSRHLVQRRALRFFKRLDKDVSSTTDREHRHMLFAAVRETQCQGLHVGPQREAGRTLDIFRRRKLMPQKGHVFDEEQAGLARRLVERAVAGRLERNARRAGRKLKSSVSKYKQRERRAHQEIDHERNESIIRVELEDEERALTSEVVKLKQNMEVARFQAAHRLFELDVRLQELNVRQNK